MSRKRTIYVLVVGFVGLALWTRAFTAEGDQLLLSFIGGVAIGHAGMTAVVPFLFGRQR